jgi:methanethiol S-methyltransferase
MTTQPPSSPQSLPHAPHSSDGHTTVFEIPIEMLTAMRNDTTVDQIDSRTTRAKDAKRTDAGRCPLRMLSPASDTAGGTTARVAVLTYGVVAYVCFFAAFLYAIGFIERFLVPKHIDTGPVEGIVPSLLINSALLMVFVVQHTVMARPAFKRWWTRIVPASIERSTYVIAASLSLGLVFWQWRPLPTVLWQVDQPVVAGLIIAISALGWGIVLISSFAVSHFDLFGLRQVWLRFLGREYVPVGFRLVGLYRVVRHPLMLGFLIAFWATPLMTVGHLFFAVMVTGYIMFGTWVEERDLVSEHGETYLKYRRGVRKFLPIPKRNVP